ncbi:MAG TPA: J domain-containing protein [Candidatus Limnocylindrales bacterium]|nr:J domain-containing protein [Candidatus Limnocylindrales bacterium]
MPARHPLPTDDLYARLGVPRDASPEAIELAWRALLRKHHPDVAGPDGLELAKRINVAHDWLSDPDLRRRYDRERWTGVRAGRPPRAGPDWSAPVRRTVRRPPTTSELVASVIERVGRLTRDELDRLALTEPAPIAFLATLRQVVSPELERQLDDAERAALANLPPAARRSTPIRDAVVGRLADILLADTLDEILGDPASIWARERLTRGWDSAVGQPRYGPATEAVMALLDRLRRRDADGLRQLAGTGTLERLADAPWPDATSPEEDDALRVSSELAAADAISAVDEALVRTGTTGIRAVTGARRAAARIAHLLVLRHAFPVRAFERHASPWLGDLIERPTPWGARPARR